MSRRTVMPVHPPVVDPTVPADQQGHRFCRRCSLAIVDGDPRHTLPPPPDGADHGQLAAGEGGEG